MPAGSSRACVDGHTCVTAHAAAMFGASEMTQHEAAWRQGDPDDGSRSG